MAEANEVVAAKKPKAEVLEVTMADGRKVGFAGKRKVLKRTIIDEAKISKDADGVYIGNGAISVGMDFRNGKSLVLPLSADMIARFAGHGGEQKYGDELASSAAEPMSEDDMVLAIEDLHQQLYGDGNWSAVREGGGGFAGASVVVLAIVEASGKTVEEVKAFLQGKLDAAKAAGQKLSRKELYDSFRSPKTKVGQIVERMEKERLAKDAKVDGDAALAEFTAA